MFKFIKSVLSVTNSALDVTNSALNQVNDGLQSISTSLRNYNERASFFRELAKLVYENKISKRDGLNQIQEKIGLNYLDDFDDYLEFYCELECKEAVYKIFPIERPNGLLDRYFEDNSEEIFSRKLMTKYGVMYKNPFKTFLKERKKKICDFLVKGVDYKNSYTVTNLSNDKLNIAYWTKMEEIRKLSESDEFQAKWRKLTGTNYE